MKLTEKELDEITKIKSEAVTLDDTFSAWRETCEKVKQAFPDLRRGDLVIAISRLMYLAGYREGLETLNEGLEDGLDLPDLGL